MNPKAEKECFEQIERHTLVKAHARQNNLAQLDVRIATLKSFIDMARSNSKLIDSRDIELVEALTLIKELIK
jgi:hypothetical protein